jgi:cell division protein FtsB
MAGRPKKKTRVSRSKRRLRLLWLGVLLLVASYFYYQPLASYVETRNQLATARAEVETLRIAKSSLEDRLQSTSSLEATKREARRIGYVLPGEQLFVIKGIPAWRKAKRP